MPKMRPISEGMPNMRSNLLLEISTEWLGQDPQMQSQKHINCGFEKNTHPTHNSIPPDKKRLDADDQIHTVTPYKHTPWHHTTWTYEKHHIAFYRIISSIELSNKRACAFSKFNDTAWTTFIVPRGGHLEIHVLAVKLLRNPGTKTHVKEPWQKMKTDPDVTYGWGVCSVEERRGIPPTKKNNAQQYLNAIFTTISEMLSTLLRHDMKISSHTRLDSASCREGGRGFKRKPENNTWNILWRDSNTFLLELYILLRFLKTSRLAQLGCTRPHQPIEQKVKNARNNTQNKT